MIYLADVPAKEEIAAYYRSYVGSKGYPQRHRLSTRELISRSKLDLYVRVLETTGGLHRQSLLEIGSAYGRFLQVCAHQGAEAAAVETDDDARRFLTELGYEASEKINDAARYDIVCALQLLEHLPDPGAMLAQAARVLKQDGRLLVSLPNGGEADKQGPTWVGFRLDFEHLNYFSLKSLGRLLGRHQLYIEQFWEHSQPSLARTIGAPPRPITLLRRLYGKALALRHQLQPGLQVPDPRQGSFVLTVLARRA